MFRPRRAVILRGWQALAIFKRMEDSLAPVNESQECLDA